MSAESEIRQMIDRMDDGLDRRVLMDVYRELVLANLIGTGGRRNLERLNREYPAQGLFKAMRTRRGYDAALHSPADMIQANIDQNEDLSDDVRRSLRSLLRQLIEEGVVRPPAEGAIPRAPSDEDGTTEETGRARTSPGLGAVPGVGPGSAPGTPRGGRPGSRPGTKPLDARGHQDRRVGALLEPSLVPLEVHDLQA